MLFQLLILNDREMKKITCIIICLLTINGQFTFAQTALPPAEFEKKMQAIQPQLLDVRTAGEYQRSHMANALQADWMNMQQFADRVQYLDKTKPVFVYCASGGRSAEAAKYLKEKGFTNVEDLKGGLTSWKNDGKPVIAVNKEEMKIGAYRKLAGSAGVVLVDFGAEWCPPCRKMEPVLDSLQKEAGTKFSFVKVDGGNDMDVMKEMRVEALPTFIIYKNGKEVWRKQGIVSLEEFKSKL